MALQPTPIGNKVPPATPACSKHERYMVVLPADVSTNNTESQVQPGRLP